MNRFFWPLALFALLLVLLAAGLMRDQHALPSPLLGKPAPDFHLSTLENPDKKFSPQQMRGQVWLLNVWSTWCVSCRREHAPLVQLADKVPIIGLNYKEVRGDAEIESGRLAPETEGELARARARQWLNEQGNPYVTTVHDLDGRIGLEYGVYGVPETFVIDSGGIIRFRQTGPLTADTVARNILPLLAELRATK